MKLSAVAIYKKVALNILVAVLVIACGGPKQVSPEVIDPIAEILNTHHNYPKPSPSVDSLGIAMLRIPSTGTAAPFNYHQQVPVTEIVSWYDDQAIGHKTWLALQRSCLKIAKVATWQSVCGFVKQYPLLHEKDIRIFFEQNFNAYVIKNNQLQDGIMTGYYEPIINGSATRQGSYQYPLYAMPPHWKHQRNLPTTQEILEGDLLRGYEVVYLDDPVEGAFIQIQGSAKIRLVDGGVMQIAYAGNNGQPFASMANWLVHQGQMKASQASMQGIKTWAMNNPNKINLLLSSNPRFIVFSASRIDDNAATGPIGSLGVPLVGEHSVAVDKSSMPLGTPLFIDTLHPLQRTPFSRLVMAQDTGAAIKGSARVDFFWGSGNSAGEVAGITKQTVRLWALWPK